MTEYATGPDSLERKPGRSLAAAVAATAGTAGLKALRERREPSAWERLRQSGRGGDIRPVLTTDGIKLHVEIDGADDAPMTVIFCHGVTLNLTTWREQRAALADSGVRRVFYDQRCHGLSDRGPMDATTGPAQLGRDLRGVIETVAPRGPVILVGHSMGSITIINLAAVHPELFGSRVVASVLMAGTAGGLDTVTFGLPSAVARLLHDHTAPTLDAVSRRPAMVRALNRKAPYRMVARQIACGPGTSRQVLRITAALMAGTPLGVTGEFIRALDPWDGRAALSALGRARTLILAAEHDKCTPPSHAEALAREIPGAELAMVACGHMLPLEYPEVVNRHLAEVITASLLAAHAEPYRGDEVSS